MTYPLYPPPLKGRGKDRSKAAAPLRHPVEKIIVKMLYIFYDRKKS